MPKRGRLLQQLHIALFITGCLQNNFASAAPGDCTPAGDPACVCDPGGYGPAGGPCAICQEGGYCPGGQSILQCPRSYGYFTRTWGVDAQAVSRPHPAYGRTIIQPPNVDCNWFGAINCPLAYQGYMGFASGWTVSRDNRWIAFSFTNRRVLHNGAWYDGSDRILPMSLRSSDFKYNYNFKPSLFEGTFPSYLQCHYDPQDPICSRLMPMETSYVDSRYSIPTQDSSLTLFAVPFSIKKHGFVKTPETTEFKVYHAESILWSEDPITNNTAASRYGHVRVYQLMEPCAGCTWTNPVILFELPFTLNQELVDLTIDKTNTILYLTTTIGIYTFHIYDRVLLLRYAATTSIKSARITRQYERIYFAEYKSDMDALILKVLDTATYNIQDITHVPSSTLICEYPVGDNVAYTAKSKIFKLNTISNITAIVSGTFRDADESDTVSLTNTMTQVNLYYGLEDHHCTVTDINFRMYLVKNRGHLSTFRADYAPAISPAGSDSIDDCACSSGSWGVPTSSTSKCTYCPSGSSTVSGNSYFEDQCTCISKYEQDAETNQFSCIPCPASLGCLRDRLPTPEVRIRFRIRDSKEKIEAKSDIIKSAIATILKVPSARVFIRAVKFISSPGRRLLQTGYVSEVEAGIITDDGGTNATQTNLNLATTTQNIMNSMSNITNAISNVTGTTVDFEGTSCNRLEVPPGYYQDSKSCSSVDINECHDFNPCHEIASCTNLPGSFTCDCPRGTYGDGFHCDGNALSIRITLATNATENQYTAELKDNMARLYAAILLTGATTGDEASNHQADHSISTFSKLPDDTLLVDIDVLFATTEMQAAALNRFDSLLFTTQANQQPSSNYRINVEYAPRKLTLMGLMTDSIERQSAKGLNVLSISFDPSCEPTGCWRIIARYSNSDPDSTAILYLPRSERDTDGTSYSNSFVKTYIATEFPCKSSDIPATGCCIPSVLARYHTTAILAQETSTEPFSTAVAVCDPNNPTAAPNPKTLLESKNYVIGSVDSLPASRIEYVRIVDPDLDIYEIELILDEDELRSSMAQVIGDVNMEYELKTFIGMAYLTPMGTSSYFNTQNTQTAISVRRTNYFTISTTGPVDFTNLDFSSAQLHETRVTYGLSVIQLQHVEVTIMFKNNIVPDTINGPFPLDGIRVGKGSTIDTVQWSHACYTSDSTGIFDSATTRAKFAASKAQQTCSRQIDICTQPASFTGNVLRINVPLGEDFWTAEDLEDPNIGVYVDITVKLRDSSSSASAFNVFRAYAPVAPTAIIQHCETREALTDLSAMLDVDLIVGTELLSVNETMPSGTYFTEIENTPGTGNSSSINIAAATIQSAMITIVVRGDPIFFDLTPRYYVDLNDAISIHFLESSPVAYSSVVSLVQLNRAFAVKVNATGFPFIEATPELLSVCSYNNLPNHMACVLRRDVTYTEAVTANRAVELSTNAEEQAASFMTDIFSGSTTEFTQNLGRAFWRNVTSRFGVNDRYVRAWSFNPAHAWPLTDVQAAGFSRSTLQTNLLVFALLSLRDSQAPPQAATQRRLLQVTTGDPSVRGEAPTFQSIENTAIDNTAQKCNAFGTAPEQCAIVDCSPRMPFKTSYCSILTSNEAYNVYYNDLKIIINRAFSADIARGYRVKHILPHSLSKLLETQCAGTSTIRRLLQTTMETQSEVLFEVPENGKLQIDIQKLESGGILTKITRVTTSGDSSFADIVDGTLSAGQNVQSTKSSKGISTGAIVGIVAGILVLICMVYCLMADNSHDNHKKSAAL